MKTEELETKFLNQYESLNKDQKEAVDTIEGPVMVVAGPGTGKTTLLTLRIANILEKTDIDPENILALTFTNAGVKAMRTKLVGLIGDLGYRVNIFTFHSFSENIIKKYPDYFPEIESSNVIRDVEKIHILENILSNNKYEYLKSKHNPLVSLMNLRNAINNIKHEGISPEDFLKKTLKWRDELLSDDSVYYKRKTGKFNVGDIKKGEEEKIDKKIERSKEIYDVYVKYQEKLEENNLYDFSDMILSVLKSLKENEDLKYELQEQFQYVLVDEHQDTNSGQNNLIEYLTDAEHLNNRPNIFAVGDEKQSIYRFQGASKETFNHFLNIYEDVKIISLKENYRSTKDILDNSNNLILNTIPESISLNSNKKDSENISVLNFSNTKFEYLFIAKDIKEKIEKQNINPKEIAIIFKKNRDIGDLKIVLEKEDINYTVQSNEYLLEDILIRQLIDLLKVIKNPLDNYSLSKILFANFILNNSEYKNNNERINPNNIAVLLNEFNKQNRKENESLSLIKFIEDSEFKFVSNLIGELVLDSKNESFESLFKIVLEKSNYLKYILENNRSRDNLIKVDKLFDEIKRMISENHNFSIDDFIKNIDSYLDYGIDINTSNPEIIEGIQLLTAHKSKGLEFECVYIVDAVRSSWEKNRIPPSFSIPIEKFKGDIDDERRLFYVAATRAKSKLTITNSNTDWEGKPKEQSQFISEMGDGLDVVEIEEFEKENIKNIDSFLINYSNKDSQVNKKSVFDKEYLFNLFLNSSLNVSALNNYLDCPIKYLFRSLIRIPSSYDSNLVFGNIIHNSLESYFKKCISEEKILDKKVLLDIYEDKIKLSSIRQDFFDHFYERGEKLLEDYYDFRNKDWTHKVKVEEYIKRDYLLEDKETKLTLSGILDKIEIDNPDKVKIIDYKTGKPLSEKTRKEDKQKLFRQLDFYFFLLEDNEKFNVESATLEFLEKNTKEEYEFETKEKPNPKVLDELKLEINNMFESIKSGQFLESGCNKKDCESCRFFNSLN